MRQRYLFLVALPVPWVLGGVSVPIGWHYGQTVFFLSLALLLTAVIVAATHYMITCLNRRESFDEIVRQLEVARKLMRVFAPITGSLCIASCVSAIVCKGENVYPGSYKGDGVVLRYYQPESRWQASSPSNTGVWSTPWSPANSVPSFEV